MTAPTYAVVNPATGETLKTYDVISDDDLKAAIGRAAAAAGPWGRETSLDDRVAAIRRVAALHTERREELAAIIVREMGKPVQEALGEVDFAAAIYEYYADTAGDLLKDEPIRLLDGDGSAVVRRTPVGLLLGIMPWNFPYYQVARFAGPNLLIGNTILLKHAPQCPESSAAMEEIFHAAGVPTDAYINIYATNEQIEWVIGDPRVQGVSLTGSGRAGAAVAQIAGRHLKKVVLELGGADPFLVLDNDNLDPVVEAATAARMGNGGQACNAAKRFVVLDKHYDEFVQKLTDSMLGMTPSDPTSDDTTLGPLSSVAAAERLEQQVEQALAGGARLVAGGGRDGAFYKPAVIADITPDNPAYSEEFFGPVAQVYKVGSEQEAIALANDTPYGLGSYVFSSDADQANRVADQIEAGMVFVNVVDADGVELPFGGVKASGFGRELGRFGADEFVNKKLIRIG
ncbi:NAD-dependent succinate-semialdehyde dehydrogenase [Conexibacter sp. JD483]|uniref:NAD-dependent succinate-semialdehyde dehydrogenase n=1 Tax=unclassified Conexibacter TaxID=2627773 RepID=UPI0027177E1A|nr:MULTISPECIES: NAD-dependent succinate-semialdehyde dehydrogenase [unclassified Conexibacter]MDO8188116.1 NAD-dependent succinate-semialdehyde dehydrogenase [Conexibacter sp. CPCC 205706]MDO8201320.1 NAD-dependent succinate-semialdehyde dehydrogenase [Conexibacter sp. CPCC 205762]MDR9373013.1 NAD-dependent succinate-semialdehyde dehydrogenase [Conexibacter sp. JD483]